MDDAPAWLSCQDIFSRAQEEMISLAIEALDVEIAAKRMKIEGKLVSADEATNEVEKKLFVINNIINNEQGIYEKYNSSISRLENNPQELTSDVVERIDELKRFLLAVGMITMLMRYSKIFRNWQDDVGHYFKEKNPVLIIKKTLTENRVEALKFIIESKRIQGLFGENEIEIMMAALLEFKKDG